jgi:hypothetical protein
MKCQRYGGYGEDKLPIFSSSNVHIPDLALSDLRPGQLVQTQFWLKYGPSTSSHSNAIIAMLACINLL